MCFTSPFNAGSLKPATPGSTIRIKTSVLSINEAGQECLNEMAQVRAG